MLQFFKNLIQTYFSILMKKLKYVSLIHQYVVQEKKHFILLFLFLSLYTHKTYAFIEVLEKGINAAENALLYTDAINDIIESVEDVSDSNSEIRASSYKLKQISHELRELGYTQNEIESFIDLRNINSKNLIYSLNKVSRKIRSGKNLLKKVGIISVAKPEAVAAAEIIKTNSKLDQLIYESRQDRLERQLERQEKSLAEVKRRKSYKKLDDFINAEFEAMQGIDQKSKYKSAGIKIENINGNTSAFNQF